METEQKTLTLDEVIQRLEKLDMIDEKRKKWLVSFAIRSIIRTRYKED
ncbi:hypothetical protein IC620_16175 [Hazenella sp. IB182357]|uniref:Uncharacterized protein n=1 Tax=Polycladospora coralii TaxID=2771432 RepID=A0A926NC64_9BACL|nr:hypothetical protein [Polycladospora coralii]MBD1373882.1 hypothetical protein [Polycladospora coralii]